MAVRMWMATWLALMGTRKCPTGMEEADEEAWTDPVDTRLTHSRTRSRAMRNARPGVLGAFGQTCEVCVGTLDRMLEGTKRTDRNQVEKAIDAYCDTAQDKEAKLCYSLSVIKKDVSQVVSMGLPTPKICEVCIERSACATNEGTNGVPMWMGCA